MANREPRTLPVLSPKDIERFWTHVARRGPEDCWLWQGCMNQYGYGQFAVGDRKHHRKIPAHRIAYFLGHGVDPGLLFVCHKCDNPPCQNPAHYFLGNRRENAEDAISKGFWVSGVKHHWAKLTEGDIIEIRALHATGQWRQREIAAKFGVCQANICLIVTRQKWRHVP